MDFSTRTETGPQRKANSSPLLYLSLTILVLIVFIAAFLPRHKTAATTDSNSIKTSRGAKSRAEKIAEAVEKRRRFVFSSDAEFSGTAEEIVAEKVRQFGRKRHALVRTIAHRLQQQVPGDVESFFEAIEAGDWEKIHSLWRELATHTWQFDFSIHDRPELEPFWESVHDAYGVAEQAHNWPAQELLDYGNAVLGSLRPGMVYVGGTDPGRWIPELLNETGNTEPHIILTQNALADAKYLEYFTQLYGDRFATLTEEDSQRAFQQYTADAQQRLEHDQQFPDEPKQVKPGENISIVDGKVQVSGQVAVMSINERLFGMLMDKNPDASFAIEQSFPFTSTYAQATPLGPIMELRVQDDQQALTSDRAAQAVDYWNATAQQLLTDPETPAGSDPRKAYSKMVADQAGLLLNRGYAAQAEEEFQIANQLCPSSPEAVFQYVNFLISQKRFSDAVGVVNSAIAAAPDNRQFSDLLSNIQKAGK